MRSLLRLATVVGLTAGTVRAAPGATAFAGARAAFDPARALGLPLRVLPPGGTGLADSASPGGGTFLVLLSGDGGWADIDRTLAAGVNAAGFPVAGLDDLAYLKGGGSPERTAADLAAVVRACAAAWGRPRVVLAGFSRGADILPFAVTRLPPDVRAAVRSLVLLSPELEADFCGLLAHAVFGPPKADRLPIAAELARLGDLRVVGVYGAGESARSVCTAAPAAFARVVRLPGDHHFGGSPGRHAPYAAVAEILLAELR